MTTDVRPGETRGARGDLSRYSKIRAEKDGAVATIRLNRPDVLNALSSELMEELLDALLTFERDEDIRCIILAGSDRVFSAGADIKEMSSQTAVEALKASNLERFDAIQKISKPIIGAIGGYCFGGGLELAMTCDIIVASESARLGQPEINIGVIPGAGGTQRLTRAVGKYKAMELILTGRQMTAREAYDNGLVSKLVPDEALMPEARRLAEEIAAKSPLAVRVAKDCVLKSYEMPLADGLQYERRSFYLLLSSEDKAEGMRAFIEKRKPSFKGR